MQTIKFSKLIKKIQRAVEQKGFYIYAENKCSTKKENRKFNINSINDVVDVETNCERTKVPIQTKR